MKTATYPSRERTRSAGRMTEMFTAHPRDLGMSWAAHGRGAAVIGATMIVAGAACLIHSLVPGWFTQTAGRAVAKLSNQMHDRRASAPDPSNWPDYEI